MLDKETVTCPICKKENHSDINFCEYCRYPINVKKIDEFTKEELMIHLSNFLDVIKERRLSRHVVLAWFEGVVDSSRVLIASGFGYLENQSFELTPYNVTAPVIEKP